jgi:hypothetical protein
MVSRARHKIEKKKFFSQFIALSSSAIRHVSYAAGWTNPFSVIGIVAEFGSSDLQKLLLLPFAFTRSKRVTAVKSRPSWQRCPLLQSRPVAVNEVAGESSVEQEHRWFNATLLFTNKWHLKTRDWKKIIRVLFPVLRTVVRLDLLFGVLDTPPAGPIYFR